MQNQISSLFLPIQWEVVYICSWSLSVNSWPTSTTWRSPSLIQKVTGRQVVIQRGHANMALKSASHSTAFHQPRQPPAVIPTCIPPYWDTWLQACASTFGLGGASLCSPFDIYDTTKLCKGVKANAPRTSNIKDWFFFTQPRTRPLALAFAGLVKSFSSCNIPKHFFQESSNHSSVRMCIWVQSLQFDHEANCGVKKWNQAKQNISDSRHVLTDSTVLGLGCSFSLCKVSYQTLSQTLV